MRVLGFGINRAGVNYQSYSSLQVLKDSWSIPYL